MPNFSYYHVEVCKGENTNEVVVKGDMTNESDKGYTSVAVRILLFMKNVTVANVVFTINGLPAGATKAFRKVIPDLDYYEIGKDITRCEVNTESAF